MSGCEGLGCLPLTLFSSPLSQRQQPSTTQPLPCKCTLVAECLSAFLLLSQHPRCHNTAHLHTCLRLLVANLQQGHQPSKKPEQTRSIATTVIPGVFLVSTVATVPPRDPRCSHTLASCQFNCFCPSLVPCASCRWACSQTSYTYL